MDQKDVEMEEAGKLLEDEVVGDQEYAEKDHPDVTQVGDKQEDSFGVVHADVSVQSPNEIGVEQEQEEQQEELSKEDAEEMNPNISDHVDVTQDDKKDATEMGDDNVHDSNKDATEMSDADKIDDSKQDATEMGDDDKINDSKQDATEMGDNDKIDDSKQDATEMGDDDKIDDSKQDATEMGDDDKIDDSKHDATEMGDDDKIDDSKKVATEMGDDDKLDDSKKVATEMGDDDKLDDSKTDATLTPNDDQVDDIKNDATDMDDDRGAIDETDDDGSVKIPENNDEGDNTGYEKHQELATPHTLVKYSPSKAEDHIAETPKNEQDDAQMDEGYESGTADDQERFMKEVDNFYKEKGLEFKPPKFYGQMLNCLKLWRSVIKLGGYDRVTGNKWWRQVGEAFHPPKTCTTVSWTFRQFYEKALLEYERHKVQTGDVELPLATVLPEAPTVEHEANGHQLPGSGSGRARRDAAARAMQGWHTQRLLNYGSEEKNFNNSQKREKSLKSIGLLKQKRPSEVEHSVKAARTETSRQVVTTVADIGPPANWVKINVRETKDCFEVYVLVPGLLREEVRVQSDPAGRVVITGQPEQLDNPWGISAFKKVISLPARIDPLRTSAIVSLHGRLLVRVPFEQSNI